MDDTPAQACFALEQALLADEGLALGGRPVASAGPRLRIAVFTENFLPKVDGVTRTIARLLAHLKAQGHEAIVCGPETARLERFCGHALVQTKGIPLICYPGLKLNFFRPLFIRRLLEFRPSVILFIDPIWLCAQSMPAILTFLPDVPRVCSFHTNLPSYAGLFGFSFLEPLMWRLIRHLHHKSSVTLCPSASTAAVLESKGFRNVRIWSRGVDTVRFSPQSFSTAQRAKFFKRGTSDAPVAANDDEVALLFVGRISFEKNLRLLVESAAAVHDAGVRCRLVLVGDGPARDAIERLATSLGVPITFMGHLRGEALAASFASADIFAFPSWSETFGQVVLEALASGLPVVGLKAEGVRDLVEDGKTGLLLDFDDLLVESKASSPAQIFAPQAPTFQIAVSRYSRLLIDLSRDRTKRSRMASAAVAKASEYSWSNAMEDVLDIFRDLIEGGAGDDGVSDSSVSPASVPLSRTSSFGFDPVGGAAVAPAGNRNIRSLVSQASTFLLRRRFGRLPGSPGSVLVDLSRWRTSDGGFTKSGEGLLEAEIEERATCKLDDLQLAYFKSGAWFSRFLIVAVVVSQLVLWTLGSTLQSSALLA